MSIKDLKMKPNQTILKVYGTPEHKKIKVIQMNWLRTSGVESDEEKAERGTANDSKLEDNILRAKSKIFELAFCNHWDWFFTGTLDKTKYDRTDLDKYHKDLTQWFRDYKKKTGIQIAFLLIPELHSDGKSWHMHGFLRGIPIEHLVQFRIGDKMGKALADKVQKGDAVFNWPAYSKKFGFCDLEPIKNHEAVSKYVTKYVSKSLAEGVTELNAHMYYHSRGLNEAEVIKKGSMAATIEPDYENEYCRVTWVDYSETVLNELLGSFSDIDYYNTRIKLEQLK